MQATQLILVLFCWTLITSQWIFFFFYKYFIVPCGKFGSPYPGKAQQPQEQRYPLLWCVQYFHVSKQWYGCQCLGCLTCAHMLTHAAAHGGCTDTVRESALKLTLGETSLATPRTQNTHTWLFSRTLYHLSYSRNTLYFCNFWKRQCPDVISPAATEHCIAATAGNTASKETTTTGRQVKPETELRNNWNTGNQSPLVNINCV